MADYNYIEAKQAYLKLNGTQYPVCIVTYSASTMTAYDRVYFPASILNNMLAICGVSTRESHTFPATSTSTGDDGTLSVIKDTYGQRLRFILSNNEYIMDGSQHSTRPSPYGFIFEPAVFYYNVATQKFSTASAYRMLPENSIQPLSSYILEYINDVPMTVLSNLTTNSYYHPMQLLSTTQESFLQTHIAYQIEHADPYENGGTSEPGGGGGSFDDSTDTITIPSYTDEQLLNRAYGYCGFINVYVTNRTELIQLHNYMFSSLITDTIKKMFADPIECILSLTMLPFELTSEIASNMIIGTVDSGIATHVAEQQYITIDCGYIDLTEYWKSYLDFSPYTKTSIYLPYIGTRELDTDKIMGRRISVKYVMDIVSGSCIAYISAETAYDNESLPAETAPLGVIYQFSGNAAIQVPISSATYGEFYASLISGLVAAGATAASIYTGGMSAPVGVAALSGAAINVANSKPQISASGALPAVTGWLGIQKPYITIERPKQCLPEDQNMFTGYPAFVTLTPGDTSGYTEFEVIHLENIPATDTEKDEIMNLMKTGVIL